MNIFEWLKFAYPLDMATLEQCKTAVQKAKITTEQFKTITGTDYVA